MTEHETAAGVGERECRYPCDCDEFPEEHCACMEGHAASTDPAPERGLWSADPFRRLTDTEGRDLIDAGRSAGRDNINRVAHVLMGAWLAAEGKEVSASKVATFADMARAVLAAHPAPETPEQVQGGGSADASGADERLRIHLRRTTGGLGIADLDEALSAAATRARAEGLRDFADWWDDPANAETLRQMANLHYRAGGPSMPAIIARLHAARIARGES